MSPISIDGGYRFGVQVVRSLHLVETRRGKKTFLQPKIFLLLRYKDKEVFSKDVTAYNILNSEAADKLNLMIAAGDINASAFRDRYTCRT
jgi:hypothetical protein